MIITGKKFSQNITEYEYKPAEDWQIPQALELLYVQIKLLYWKYVSNNPLVSLAFFLFHSLHIQYFL